MRDRYPIESGRSQAVLALLQKGRKCLKEEVDRCSGSDSWGSVVAFCDPDGTVIELAEQPFMLQIFSALMRLKDKLV